MKSQKKVKNQKEDSVCANPNLPTIAIEKNSHDQTQLDYLDQLGFIYGSVILKYVQQDNLFKKKLIFRKEGWKNQKQSFYTPKWNGIYILTGPISNCFVIDIDNLQKPEAAKLKELCQSDCNLIVQSKKGPHFYYTFDNDLNLTRTFENFGFDIRAQGGIILSPPSFYFDENNNRIQYEYKRLPEGHTVNSISQKTKEYLFQLIVGPIKNKKEMKNHIKEVKKIINIKIDPIKETHDGIKKVLDGLDKQRSVDYHDWLYCGWILKNEGYGLELWDYFSKKSDTYCLDSNYPFYEKYFMNNYDEENRLTIATLWYWLRCDDPKLFHALRKEKIINEYKLNSDFKIEIFDNFDHNVMLDLFEADMIALGPEKYSLIIELTNSFKYFNKFHMETLGANYKYTCNKNNKYWENIGFELKKPYRNLKVELDKKKWHFYKFYEGNLHKPYYNKIEFEPDKKFNKHHTINMFKGFKYENSNIECDLQLIKPILDHIVYLCNCNQTTSDYVINRCAYIIQHPSHKRNLAIVFYCLIDDDSGANIFVSIMGKIFGDYFGEFDNKDLKWSMEEKFRYKYLMVGKNIILRKHESLDFLNERIEKPGFTIYGDSNTIPNSYTVNDYCNFILFVKDERSIGRLAGFNWRYNVIFGPQYGKEKEYYNYLENVINDEKIMESFFIYLKTKDLKNFDPSEF